MENNKQTEEWFKIIMDGLEDLISGLQDQKIPEALIAEIILARTMAYARDSAPCFHAFFAKIGDAFDTASQLMGQVDHANGKCD